MNRRKALSIAGTVTATVVGGTLAVAANFGLLGFARTDAPSLGVLEANHPVTTSTTEPPPEIITREEDVFVTAPPSRPATRTSAAPTTVTREEPARSTTTTTAPRERFHEDDHSTGDGVDSGVVEGLRDDD